MYITTVNTNVKGGGREVAYLPIVLFKGLAILGLWRDVSDIFEDQRNQRNAVIFKFILISWKEELEGLSSKDGLSPPKIWRNYIFALDLEKTITLLCFLRKWFILKIHFLFLVNEFTITSLGWCPSVQ